jgi:hypothetical protein
MLKAESASLGFSDQVCAEGMPLPEAGADRHVKKELENRLAERWPSWFDMTGDVRRTLMSFGFMCGDGWFDLIWRLCERLEPLVATLEQQTSEKFEVVEVKNKFSGLRFYTSHSHGSRTLPAIEAIRKCIEEAQAESFDICETCGKPGQPRAYSGYMPIHTLCDEHAQGKPVFTGWDDGP